MNVTVAMRVKNEARWIRRCIEAILPVCQRVVVFDDHSEDETAQICAEIPGVEVIQSPFFGLDEARDKNMLLDYIRAEADWVLMIDGDELLMDPGAPEILRRTMEKTNQLCISLPILYAWDRENQVRVDGVYGNYRRQSAFRPGTARFHSRGEANFHCGNVPAEIRNSIEYVETPLLHFGYMHCEDRIRKYNWYNEHDPNNPAEDGYRHMVIGDLFDPQCEFRHGGPLELRNL